MPRPVPGRQRDRVRLVRGQHALLLVELPDEDPIQAQVDVQHEAPGGIGLDHVRVGPIVSAEGEAARRGVGRPGGADLAGIVLDVGGVAQAAVGQDRQHRHGAAEIVGHQHEPSRRMDAHISRAGAAGADGVEQRQMPVGPIDGEGADRAFLVVAHPVGLVGGIQAGPGGIQGQAARAGPHLVDAGGRHRPGGAIHPEEVDAAAVAGRQVHLRRQHVAERGAEGADIGDERPGGFVRSRPERTGDERGRPRQRDGGLQERTPGTVGWSHGDERSGMADGPPGVSGDVRAEHGVSSTAFPADGR